MSLPSHLTAHLQRALSSEWRESVGADIYQQYVKLRLRLLKAEVLSTGGEQSIEYFRVDQGKKERLIFLPGFADSKENFFDPAQQLISNFDLLVPDLPGFGRSFKAPDACYSLSQYGDWMQKFIEDVDARDFHLLGNSLGGAVAIELALRIPERIRSLTLIDPAGIALPQYNSVYTEFVQGRNVFEIQNLQRFDYFLHRVFHRPPLIPPFVREHLFRDMADNSRWHRKVLDDLLSGLRDFDDPRFHELTLNQRLGKITLPTLIIWGDEDSFFPSETAHYVQQQIPNSKLYIMQDCGHIPQLESPRQFAKLVKKFVRDLRHRTST